MTAECPLSTWFVMAGLVQVKLGHDVPGRSAATEDKILSRVPRCEFPTA
jgi:hypothetical protein